MTPYVRWKAAADRIVTTYLRRQGGENNGFKFELAEKRMRDSILVALRREWRRGGK